MLAISVAILLPRHIWGLEYRSIFSIQFNSVFTYDGKNVLYY